MTCVAGPALCDSGALSRCGAALSAAPIAVKPVVLARRVAQRPHFAGPRGERARLLPQPGALVRNRRLREAVRGAAAIEPTQRHSAHRLSLDCPPTAAAAARSRFASSVAGAIGPPWPWPPRADSGAAPSLVDVLPTPQFPPPAILMPEPRQRRWRLDEPRPSLACKAHNARGTQSRQDEPGAKHFQMRNLRPASVAGDPASSASMSPSLRHGSALDTQAVSRPRSNRGQREA